MVRYNDVCRDCLLYSDGVPNQEAHCFETALRLTGFLLISEVVEGRVIGQCCCDAKSEDVEAVLKGASRLLTRYCQS